PITITATGAVGGLILIGRRIYGTVRDPWCTPTGRVIAEIGAIVHRTIVRRIIALPIALEIGREPARPLSRPGRVDRAHRETPGHQDRALLAAPLHRRASRPIPARPE